MTARRLFVLIALTASVVLPALSAGPLQAAGEEPALTVPAPAAAALHCPSPPRAGRTPVLLVHGTFTNADESWSWGYARALPALGYDTCTVVLPDRSMGDIQVASEYVVAAVRALSAATGTKVDVVTHSQGGLEGRWAVKWWPSVRDRVDDLVMLAAPNHGTSVANAETAIGVSCPACWQMRIGSAFLGALNAGDETPGDVSYTSIYTLYDAVVPQLPPPPTSALAGARNILLQDVCPGRPVDHVNLLGDAVAFALAVDALGHPGPADPGRVSRLTCLQTTMAGADPTGLTALAATSELAMPEGFLTTAEPPLAPYARA